MADICISYSKNNILTVFKEKKNEEKKLRKKYLENERNMQKAKKLKDKYLTSSQKSDCVGYGEENAVN
jgi:hypothetical protein